jgi:hypothetical protein
MRLADSLIWDWKFSRKQQAKILFCHRKFFSVKRGFLFGPAENYLLNPLPVIARSCSRPQGMGIATGSQDRADWLVYGIASAREEETRRAQSPTW